MASLFSGQIQSRVFNLYTHYPFFFFFFLAFNLSLWFPLVLFWVAQQNGRKQASATSQGLQNAT